MQSILNLHIANTGFLTNLKLQQLTMINYLVGENGSGKSLILKYILENNRNSILIKDFSNNQNSKTLSLETLEKIQLENNDYTKLIRILPEIANFYDHAGPERGGLDKLIKLCKLIYQLKTEQNISIFLIEEPETHLHPKLQKIIPTLLYKLSNGLKIQFFVETHSPFVIVGGTQINANPEAIETVKLSPIQKVYFIKNGRIADKNGDYSEKAKYGYWGSKVSSLAAKMLGTGLPDFINSLQPQYTPDCPVLVLCEGQGSDEDERIYNTVFDNYFPKALFVSSRGTGQLDASFQLLREVKKGLSANFKMLMLRDRDHEFATQEDIVKYQHSRPGVKVLRRRAIECYLYNSEILKLIYKLQKQTLNQSFIQEMDDLSQNIQLEAENGIKGDDYKQRLRDTFLHLISPLKLSSDFYLDLNINLAKLITKETQIYQELESVIFD